MSPESEKVAVEVEGRRLTLSNLHKVLYPEVGFTKGEVIDYYTRIAPVLLPHVQGRPLTLKRYPDGVDGEVFYQKNIPAGAPDWITRVELPTPGSTRSRTTIEFAVVCDLPTLVWAANLASIELHVPMWRMGDDEQPLPPDLLVFDLDPGPPATIVECVEVAALVRDVLAEDGLHAYPKTSGSKGLQLYVPLEPVHPWQRTHAYAKQVATRLEHDHPKLVVPTMKKELRTGQVLVDWSQNNGAKTTVAVYSLRARPQPTVSTPVTWDEVEACETPADLRFTSDAALERVKTYGDLFAPTLAAGQRLPG